MDFRAETTLTPGDAVVAYWMHGQLAPHAQKTFAAGALIVTVGFGVAAYLLSFPFIAVLGIGIGGIAIITLPLLEWQIRRAVRMREENKLSVTISEGGVRMLDTGKDHHLAWDMVTKVRLDDRGVLIYVGPDRYFFIPARAWNGGYRKDDLRAFLQSVVKEPSKSPKPFRREGKASGPEV